MAFYCTKVSSSPESGLTLTLPYHTLQYGADKIRAYAEAPDRWSNVYLSLA